MRKTLTLFITFGLLLVTMYSGRIVAQATVMDEITAHPDVTLYAELLRRTGLDAILRGDGPYTVFAPVDAAIDAALAAAGIDRTALFADTALMRQIANAHIITIRATQADLRGFDLPATLATRGGASLALDVTNTALRVNGGQIITGDILTANGVLHIIDATTLTPAAAPTPAADAPLAYLRAGHFAADVGAVDLRLDGPTSRVLASFTYTAQQGYEALEPGVYTLAFVLSGTNQPVLGPFQLSLDANRAITVLMTGTQGRGTLNVRVFAEDYTTLSPGQARVTFFNAVEGAPALEIRGVDGVPLFGGLAYNGDPVFLDLTPGAYSFFAGPTDGPAVMQTGSFIRAGTAPLIVAAGTWATGNVQLSVGPSMALPGVEPVTIPDLLADPSATGGQTFNTLLTALDAAGLLPTLESPGPLTLFAPVDAAFAASPGLLGSPDLASILRHHIVNNAIPTGTDPGTLTVTTSAGASLSLTVDAAGTVTLDGGVRVLSSLEASNGVIYVIDGVLRP